MRFRTGRHACAPDVGYRSLLSNREFRAIFAAQLLSFSGDQIARIAVALAIFSRTHSALLTAASYAVSYLAGIFAAPVMSTLADRLPRRHVMVAADLIRLILAVALATVARNVPTLLAGMVLIAAVEPAFKSARAALLPTITVGEAYPLALSLFAVTNQLTQVAGFAVGGAVAAGLGIRGAFAFDAATFALSAVLVAGWVHHRPSPNRGEASGGIAEALRTIWSNRLVRKVLALAWCGAAFGVVPEGLAVVYAHAHGAGALGAGVLTASLPAGTAIGAVAVGRIRSDAARRKWLRLLAVATFLPLLIAAAGPPLPLACLLWAASGAAGAFSIIAYQTLTLAVPDEQRGRIFGLASTGLLAAQGLALLAAGAIADFLPVSYVIAGSGAVGLLATGALCLSWPATARPRRQLAVATGGSR